MNDLERDLRTVLERDVERAPLVTQPPTNLRRRVRRRQTLTALGSAVLVAALVVGSIVGMQAFLDRWGPTPADSTFPPEGFRVASLPYATIAYPPDWYLLSLRRSVNPAQPALQLTNFDPAFTEPCFTGDALDLPPDGVLLLVESGSGFTGDTAPRWPVDLAYDPAPSACRPGGLLEDPEPGLPLHYSASWSSADGLTPYQASAMVGPDASEVDRDTLIAAFASLVVVEQAQMEALYAAPALVLDTADTSVGPVVLVAGESFDRLPGPSGGDLAPGGPWVGAFGPIGSHITLALEVGAQAPRADEDITMITGDHPVVVGIVPDSVSTAEFHTAEGATSPARLVPLPARDFEGLVGVWGVLDTRTSDWIVTALYDADGTLLSDPFIPTGPPDVVANGVDPEGGAWTVSVTHSTMGDGLSFEWGNGGPGGGGLSPIPRGRDLSLVGSGSGSGVPHHVEGFATPAVDRVEIVTTDGVFPADLFQFPREYIGPVQLWVAIVPHAVKLDGDVVAYDAAGTELDREPIGGMSGPDPNVPEDVVVASGADWTLSIDDRPGLCLAVEGPAGSEGSCDYPWPSDVGVANVFWMRGDRELLYGFLDPRAATVRLALRNGETVDGSLLPAPAGFGYEGVAFAIEFAGPRQGARLTVLDATGLEIGAADLPPHDGTMFELTGS